MSDEFYSGGEKPTVPTIRSLGGPLSRSGHVPSSGVEHFIRRPACGLVAVLTELSQVAFKHGDCAELRHRIEKM